jgi:peptidoglycan/LPS O-acetylase OafA/YrhL
VGRRAVFGRNRRVDGSDVTAAVPKTKASQPANFLTIQALRAVAALLVVLYHALNMWGERVDAAAPGANWENGASGVDIFFVISGFVMMVSSRRLVNRAGAWLTFIRHRIVRLVPLYWLLTTAKIAAVMLLPALVVGTHLDLALVARSYLFLPVVDSAGHFRPVIPVGWTLTYEFLFYLFFAAALLLRVDVLRVVVPGLGLVATLALFRADIWPDWTILFHTIVIEFIFGVVLGKATLRGFHLPLVTAVGLAIGGIVAILSLPPGPENLRVLTWGVPAFAIVAGAVSLEPLVANALPRWPLALGDASYSIYLSHGFVLPAFMLVMSRIVPPGLGAEVLTVALCISLSSIAGWIVFIAVERPMLRALKR